MELPRVAAAFRFSVSVPALVSAPVPAVAVAVVPSPICRVPAKLVVAPLKVFAPERMSLPEPALVMPAEPERIEATAPVLLALTVMVGAVPARFNVPLDTVKP